MRRRPAGSPLRFVPLTVAGLPPRSSTHFRMTRWLVVNFAWWSGFLGVVGLVVFLGAFFGALDLAAMIDLPEYSSRCRAGVNGTGQPAHMGPRSGPSDCRAEGLSI